MSQSKACSFDNPNRYDDAIYGPAAQAILAKLRGFTQAEIVGIARVNDPGLIVHPDGALDKARELLAEADEATTRQVRRGLEQARLRMDRDQFGMFRRSVAARLRDLNACEQAADERLDVLDPCGRAVA